MGVTGLGSFIRENNSEFFSHWKDLKNTALDIDGTCLMHHLYQSKNVDLKFGEHYREYAQHIRTYYTNLRTHGIKPYTVFDGGYTKDGRKRPTVIKRARERVV